MRKRNRAWGLYGLAFAVAGVGLAYASVPLYRLFCQVTGYGGTVKEKSHSAEARLSEAEQQLGGRSHALKVKVQFSSEKAPDLPWRFEPVQNEVVVPLGEPTLAFYVAENLTDKPITGVATYNVVPMKAGLYFNKIQCFCFDEQRLQPHEKVEMPVFFFIDPEFAQDKRMSDIKDIMLSYTFFASDEQDRG